MIKMKQLIILQFTTLLACLVSGITHEHIWPHPQHINLTAPYYIISPSEFTIATDSKCDLILEAIKRYQTNRLFIQDCSHLDQQFKGKYFHKTSATFTADSNFLGSLKTLNLKFNGVCEKYPYMNMSEMHYISIEEGGKAEITSESAWGILRGLETFSQLLDNVGRDQFRLNTVKILDFPRFSHRGIMIDSSRHFLPLHSIFETLDAMEMNKFNVLHWHLVDDQSFPFVSETFPELSERGAFNPETHVYEKKDVEEVIEYARLRAIRVLTEFDTPGHTHAWGKGIPNLLTQCYDKNHKAVEGKFGPFDPTKNSTYEFVEKLFAEIVRRFPDQYVHLGGDEVDFTCWASNQAIVDFMKTLNIPGDYRKLESYYIQKLVKIIEQLKKSYIVWQEVFDDNVTLKADTVVHIWKKKDWQMELKNVTGRGFRALLSSPWYLNYINYGTDWPTYYQIEPFNFSPTSEVQKKLVMGGEACMWGEWVDASNLISRTWPRANAVGERLWSPATINNANNAKPRFHRQHCRMQQLGLRVQPNDGPGYYCACDYAM